MTECTRCGTETNRPALSYDIIRSPDPLKDFKDTNGVVWLCDSCIDDFKEFLADPEEPLAGDVITTIDGDVLTTETSNGFLRATTQYDVPRQLVDVVGWDSLQEIYREGDIDWTLRWEDYDA